MWTILLAALVVATPEWTTSKDCQHWPIRGQKSQDDFLGRWGNACVSSIRGSGILSVAVQRNAEGDVTAVECRGKDYTVSAQFCAADMPK